MEDKKVNEKEEKVEVKPLDPSKEKEITEKEETTNVEKNNTAKEIRREYIVEKPKGKKILVVLAIFFVIVLACVGFGLTNKLNNKVYNNVYLDEKEVSAMTEQELNEYLQKINNEIINNNINLMQEGVKITDIGPEEIELQIDIQKTVKNVMNFGRDNNLLLNNVKIFLTLFNKHSEKIIYKYSEEKLENLVQEVRGSIENRVVNDSFVLDEKNYQIVISKGTSGNGIDADNLKKDIINRLINKKKEYELKIEKQEPENLDIDIVYSKVVREAKDAYIDETKSPIKFVPHVVGLTFDKEKLRAVLQKEENQKEKITIKFDLETIQPEVKLSDLKWTLYEDKISSMTTYFTASDANRSSNLKVGLSLLEGTIVMPGETFSFNNTMGDCGLSSRGFKPAATFKAGKVVNEVGGGICQVASTLYNAVLYANLEIVKRSNHALPVGYVKPSLDATVYYPYVDFKFKNTRNYPIKIVTSYNSSGKMAITIKGTFEETEYDVVLTSKITSTIAPKVQYVNNSSMANGVTKVTHKGTSGYTSYAYRIVKLNGKVESKTLLSTDTYKSTTTTIERGTKTVEIPVEVSTPEVTNDVP